MTKLKRRAAAALILTVAMLMIAAVSLYVGRDTSKVVQAGSALTPSEPLDPVTKFRTEREELRSRQEGELNDIIHSASADSDTVNQAQRQLMQLMEARDTELRLEGILKVRGYEDALATYSADSVNVILRSEALTRRDTALILDLVLRETGVTAGNVKILSINQ